MFIPWKQLEEVQRATIWVVECMLEWFAQTGEVNIKILEKAIP